MQAADPESTLCSRNIKFLRIKRGYSLIDAASHIGVTENELIDYENDPSNLPIFLAHKLATLYKTTCNQLCYRKCSMTKAEG